ncbi:MAG TPA: TatD family hydrolase [Bacillales bacterium]|nr:TatD family hydrolase [Bacillales bacterium]
MLDAHLHLDRYPQWQLDQLIDEWQKAGIQGVVAVSTDLASSYRTLELKQRYPDFVYAAVGHHPEQAPPDEADGNELFALMACERDQLAAVGEVGLPHYTTEQMEPGNFEKHWEWLVSFIKTAKRLHLPLALHAVHEHTQPVLDLLLAHKIEHAHFHWLKTDPATLKKVFDSGYYMSLTPEVCYRERDRKLAELAPLEQLMVETDGPWPFSGPFEGKQTTPEFVAEVMKSIAEIKDTTFTEIVEQTTKNTKKVYDGG